MKKIILTTILAAATMMGASAQTADKTVVITSDWHLSDARSFDTNCYYAWTDKNQSRILSHLNQLKADRDQWDVLVLNGDIFEFWRSPVDRYMVADADGNVLNDVEYLGLIRQQNAAIFEVLEQLHADGKEIVYLPGNHDVTVSAKDIESAFPGLFTCSFDTEGTGIYEPFGTNTAVAIEHGNRYEYFNAPYQHGVFGSSNTESTSLLPPGYFTSKLGATATVYGQSLKSIVSSVRARQTDATGSDDNDADNRTYLASLWNAVRAGAGSPSYTVKTRIDGVGTVECDSCKWSDYAVSQTNNPSLFKDSWTVENWKKRCELNKVPVYLPLQTSLLSAAFSDTFDELAYTERLTNTALPTLICVWGHSHVKVLTTRHDATKGDVVYLNEGAWVDDTRVCTYGVIRYTAAAHRYAVELRQYDADGSDRLLDCRYLYVPENNVKSLPDGTLQFESKAVLLDDADVTGIQQITENATEGARYNLQGQRLAAPVRGINIVGGRKVLVK